MATLRVPPLLSPNMGRPGSLVVTDLSNKAVPILDTYSPYPVFANNTTKSRDPFGLNAFLLAPYDDVWQYMNPTVVPAEELPLDDQSKLAPPSESEARESKRLSNLRRSSPLAYNPPVSAEGEDVKTDDVAVAAEPEYQDYEVVASAQETPEMAGASNTRKSQPTGSRLRLLMGRKSTLMEAPVIVDAVEETSSTRSRLSDCRTDSVCSALSSASSSSDGSFEGIQTPADGISVPVDVSPASVAAALDEGNKKAGWRDWLSGRRTSTLQRTDILPSLHSSPRSSELDLAPSLPEPEETVVYSRVANTDAARNAVQLRRLSIAKLASLRMPSPHPLSLILTRQHVNLPDEVAYSIPASKRVFPMSVNVVQRGPHELAPAQGGGLRLALAVRGVISKIDKGERPFGASLHVRRAPRQTKIARPRGVRDFVERPPFEERMVTFYPGEVCTHVSMARKGFAVEELEFSDYIMALAETEESPPSWSGSPKPRAASTGSLPAPPRRASPPIDTKRASLDNKRESKRMSTVVLDNKRDSRVPPSSFRNARAKPSTWDDSDDDEEEIKTDSDDSRLSVQRPVAVRSKTAPNLAATRARQSRVVDPVAAMAMLNRARERRAEFNAGECERKAESDNRKSVMILPPTKPATTDARRLQHRASTATLLVKSNEQQQRPQPTKRASSGTLHAKAAAQRRESTSGSQSPPRDSRSSRPPSSLPSSPRNGPQPDRRRVVSQYDPMAAMNAHRQSMGMGLYGMPPVPTVPVFPSPMMVQPMMYAPVGMTPMMGYNPLGYNQQYPAGMPQMPQMYRPPPPQMQQIANPAMLPVRRRERPVS